MHFILYFLFTPFHLYFFNTLKSYKNSAFYIFYFILIQFFFLLFYTLYFMNFPVIFPFLMFFSLIVV